mmetsp:Transcript_41574/g.105325  ORF Transcript_41574/g.105325 Transcript_41574/m.105325 type:complete len:242 (-) Transcript_41574:219-944(-)
MALGNDSSLSGDPPPSTQERSERSGQASAQHTAHGKGSLLDGPAAVTFAYVNGDNLVHLKALNRAIFPVPYKDKFYHDCCAFQEVTQLAFYRGEAVGNVACRLERCPAGHPGESMGAARLYIMTLGLLAPYRGMGIGGALLRRVLAAVEFDPNIAEAYLHVQTSNEEALSFYSKHGFTIVDTIRNYYRRLQPPDCHVLARRLPHAALWRLPQPRPAAPSTPEPAPAQVAVGGGMPPYPGSA